MPRRKRRPDSMNDAFRDPPTTADLTELQRKLDWDRVRAAHLRTIDEVEEAAIRNAKDGKATERFYASRRAHWSRETPPATWRPSYDDRPAEQEARFNPGLLSESELEQVLAEQGAVREITLIEGDTVPEDQRRSAGYSVVPKGQRYTYFKSRRADYEEAQSVLEDGSEQRAPAPKRQPRKYTEQEKANLVRAALGMPAGAFTGETPRQTGGQVQDPAQVGVLGQRAPEADSDDPGLTPGI
jgi:hypothetical protein